MSQFARDPCADCVDDLEHCHGTAVVFDDGTAECTDDPTCVLPAIAHRHAIACDEAFEQARPVAS